ncbi:ribose 5-phosphate isomerase B [bacterium]|nr:ribose 5-phosphate isomerase B [bacterium]
MKIAFGSDHAGFALKEFLRDSFKFKGFEVIDLGTYYPTPADYPIYAKKVAGTVLSNNADFGVLICGTGLGMSITANKIAGIRAGLCMSVEYAELARKHNNANVICLGSRFIENDKALKIVEKFISTGFDGDKPNGERHKRRVAEIDEIL